jgi:hypothetical protein
MDIIVSSSQIARSGLLPAFGRVWIKLQKKKVFFVIFECHKSALVGQYFKVIGIHGGEGGLPTGGPNYKGEGRALIHGNVGNAKFEKSKKKSEKSEMGKSKIPQ